MHLEPSNIGPQDSLSGEFLAECFREIAQRERDKGRVGPELGIGVGNTSLDVFLEWHLA